jgi:hypothetical protein
MEYTFSIFDDGKAREENMAMLKAWKEKIGIKSALPFKLVNDKKDETDVECMCTVVNVMDNGIALISIDDEEINNHMQEILNATENKKKSRRKKS